MKNDNTTTRPAPASARAAQRAGQIIGERYRLEELLERGAMGSVWRAEQMSLRTPVAIKFLEPSLIGDPEMNERFMQEARSAAAVRSTHVIQIFDYGSDGNVPFIAMEFLEGEDLDARLSSRGTLTPSELNKIFSEVARGIGQAHAMGVIHRDLKPGNIFIAREGEHEITKVIDFGIAKVKADALKFTRIVGTQLGSLLGTPQYMSPEQVRGSGLLDHRTDLWALAIIACECLTGRYPFSGTTIGDLSVQICTEKPRAPSSLGPVPAGFDRWFFKGTARNAFRRFDSVEEMAAALGKILSEASDVAPIPARSARLLGALSTLVRQRLGDWRTKLSGYGPKLSGYGAKLSGYGTKLSALGPKLSAFAAVCQTRALAVARSESLRFARPLFSRTGAFASALVLVIVVCGLVLSLQPGRQASVRASAELGPTQTIRAASPSPLPPSARATASGAGESVRSVLPGPSEDVVPLGATVADAGSEPAPVVAAPRQRKRAATPSTANEKSALSPMGVAMGQAGARIMQGDGTRRARGKAAAATPQSRTRSNETAPARSPATTPRKK